MSAPARRLTQRQVDAEVSREVARIQHEYGTQPELAGKCRVCRHPDSKRRVNQMLGYGMRPQEIVDNIADINARLRKNQQIGYWSVWNHRKEHFNIQAAASEARRRILERRAEEDGNDLSQGVGTILTAKGYLEIVADKGFRNLISDDAEVGWEDGLNAQLKLETLEKADSVEAERAAMRRDVALIQQAIAETLTPEQMRAISHRLDVLRGVVSEDDEDEAIEGEIVDDADEGYGDDEADFVMDIDDEDELE